MTRASCGPSACPTFGPDRYLDIQHFARIKPAVNQIETHVFQQQKIAREYLKKYGCQVESWGPFAEGRKDMFTNPVLTAIGRKYGQDRRPDRPAFPDAERRGGHPQVRPQGPDAAEL